ncbi:serine protease [Promicromonospora sp. AC04]|uniref:serine protease n=1 Tax=Promicromonospora sp. AC04 TaxID=2135723 RepID=UPI001305008F|nr:serine protease [Promicromonospora sp. AC04]
MKRKRMVRLGAGVAAAALLWTGFAASAEAATGDGDVRPQIIGGQPAVEGQYPWLVGLGSAGDGTPWERQFCGGSVITETVVITAAHCVADVSDPEDLVVFSGSVDLESDELVETAVADVHVSEDFNDPIESANDWALLLLDEPVDVEPITLDQDPAEFEVLETAGWGNTGASYPTVAEWVEVPFVDDEACADAYPGETDSETMLCAGDLANGGVDSCDGDSGGPLMAPDEDGGQILVGIVSWGHGCAEAGNPGVYAEVADFNDPIEQAIEDWEDGE